MSVILRKMTLDDVEQVVAIDQVSFSLPWPKSSFHFELTDNPASRCWVVDVDGHVAAMLVAWLIDGGQTYPSGSRRLKRMLPLSCPIICTASSSS